MGLRVSRAPGFCCWTVKWRIVVKTASRFNGYDYGAVCIIKLNIYCMMGRMHMPAVD